MLPLRDVVLFPHVAMPLLIGRAGSLAAVSDATEGAKELLIITQRSADVHTPGAADLHRIGVVGRLEQVTRLTGGTTKILVEGLTRVKVQRFVTTKGSPLFEATVTPFPLSTTASGTTHARVRHALTLFEEYAGLQRRLPGEVVGLLQGLDDAERVRDLILERVKRTRSAGLGDERPDAAHPYDPATGFSPTHVAVLRQVRDAARALASRRASSSEF